jgi:hypothetical protein
MRKKRLADIEKDLGIKLDDLIPELVNIGGQKLAAQKLGVSQFSICEWLMRNGYTRITRYEKTERELAS